MARSAALRDSILTFVAGPVQAWYGWRLAHPSIGRHWTWFALFGLGSLLFYTEIKNVIARTAHIKELMRDRQWKITPRPALGKGAVAPGTTPPAGDRRPTATGSPSLVGSEAEADMAVKALTPHNRRATDRPAADRGEPMPGDDRHRHDAG